MKILDVVSKLKKTDEQFEVLEKRLRELRQEISNKRASITAALIDGKEIASILDEVATLQKEESSIASAAQAVQAAKAELGNRKKADELKQAEKELAAIDAELEKASIALLRDAYQSRDELAALSDMFRRACQLTGHHKELSLYRTRRNYELIAVLEQSYAAITRRMEITQPELLQAAGLERRF